MKFRLQKDFLKCVSNSHTCVSLSSPIHLELKHTLPLFPWKPYQITACKSAKTIPFGAAHIYKAYLREHLYLPPSLPRVFPSTSSLFQFTFSTYNTVHTILKVPFQWGYPIKSWKVGILFYIIKWKRVDLVLIQTLPSLLCTVHHVVHMLSSIVALLFYYRFCHWYKFNIYTKLRKRWGKAAQGSQ